MKRRIFLVCLFYCFLDCRSTNLLRLFSGNLPAMFDIFEENKQNFICAILFRATKFLVLQMNRNSSGISDIFPGENRQKLGDPEEGILGF